MAENSELLIIEDDPVLSRLIAAWLAAEPWTCAFVGSLAAARDFLRHQRPRLILVDLQLPDGDGIEFITELTRVGSAPPPTVLAMTARGSIATAVAAMKAGAYDFLVKPFNGERLLVTLHNGLERDRLQRIVNLYPTQPSDPILSRVADGAAPPASEGDPELAALGMVGASLAMQSLARKLHLVAPSRAPVFLHGESGSGKELAAEAIHRLSQRSTAPFLALNCAALPRELIESEIFGHVKGAFTGATHDRDGAASRANGGTLFFDEIAEMDLAVQAKLLRFIQSGEFQRVGGSQVERSDIRFICATHRDLWQACLDGRFRDDLYYRLVVMPLTIPPLRDRGDDCLLLARQFLRQYAQEEGRGLAILHPETERLFRQHDWPGNIRELQNILRQIVILNGEQQSKSNGKSFEVKPENLPPEFFVRSRSRGRIPSPDPSLIPSPSPSPSPNPSRMADSQPEPGDPPQLKFSLDHAESQLIKAALAAHKGNLTHTAAALGINLSTLRRRIKNAEQAGAKR